MNGTVFLLESPEKTVKHYYYYYYRATLGPIYLIEGQLIIFSNQKKIAKRPP